MWVSENQLLTKYVSSGVQKQPEAHRNEIESEDSLQSAETLTINVIFESEGGTLWLAGNEGTKEKRAVVLSFRETRLADDKLGGSDAPNDKISRPRPKIGFTRYSLPSAASNIETVTEDNSRNILFGGYNLFLKFDGDTFQRILPLGSTQRGPGWYKPPRRAAFQRDTKGRIWFSDGRVTRSWNGSQLQTLGSIQGVFEIEDAWGNLWFTNENGEVEKYDTTLKSIPYSAEGGLGIDRVRAIFEAINGDLWFGHDNGTTVFNPIPAIQNHGTGISSRVRGNRGSHFGQIL